MNPFTTLGLVETATPAEVKRAFRARLLQVHPDVIGEAGHQATIDVIAAYERAMATAKAKAPARPAPANGFTPAWFTQTTRTSFVASTFCVVA